MKTTEQNENRREAQLEPTMLKQSLQIKCITQERTCANETKQVGKAAWTEVGLRQGNEVAGKQRGHEQRPTIENESGEKASEPQET